MFRSSLVDLYLLQDGERVDFDMEGRGIDALIEIDEPNSGSYEWKIERASVPPGDNYQIELVGYGSGLSSPFSIGTDITFSVPDSGAVWVPGHTYEIRWDAGMDTADDVDLYLLQDGERVGFDMDTAIDALIDRNEPNTGIYEWGIERSGLYKVPPGDNYQIELVTSRYGSVLSPPFSFGTDIAFDFPSPEATPGDFDADGEITLSDALFTLQAALNKRELTLEQKAAADVNNDGDVTLVDALFILQAARGKRDLSAGVKPVVALEEFGEPVVLQGRFEPDGEGMIQLALSVPGRNAGALNLELSYDPEKLTWVDFENAEIERAILTEVEIPQPGTLRLMRVATGDGSGDLGRLRFQARPLTGGGEIQVAAFEYFNEHGQSLPTDARTRFDGRLRVLPTDFALHHNYPNPFNPGTAIHYDLPADGAKTVRLQIYNVLGQTIRTLVAERQEPGFYSVHWDGKDDRGASAASGLYFYRLQAGEQVLVRRMMLMR